MSHSKQKAGFDPVEACSRIAAEIRRLKLPMKTVASRVKETPDRLTKLLKPDKYRTVLKLDQAASLLSAIGRDFSWLMTGQSPSQEKLHRPQVWRMQDPANVLMEVIALYEQRAEKSSGLFRTFPLVVLTPDLLALVRDNFAAEFRGERPEQAARFSELAHCAATNYESIDSKDMFLRRRTFMRASDVRRLIRGEDEYLGRTAAMAYAFFERLRTFHVMERGYRIFFIEEGCVPPLAERQLRKYVSICVIGNELSLRRDINYETEYPTRNNNETALQEDIQLMSLLSKSVPDRQTPRRICKRISRFEDELEKWFTEHPEDSDNKKQPA